MGVACVNQLMPAFSLEKLQRLKEEEEQLRQELEKKRQQRLSVSQVDLLV